MKTKLSSVLRWLLVDHNAACGAVVLGLIFFLFHMGIRHSLLSALVFWVVFDIRDRIENLENKMKEMN